MTVTDVGMAPQTEEVGIKVIKVQDMVTLQAAVLVANLMYLVDLTDTVIIITMRPGPMPNHISLVHKKDPPIR